MHSRGNEFERAVIGSLLVAPRYTRPVMEVITPADFADMGLGKVYGGICRMSGMQEQVDAIAVAANLPEWRVPGLGFQDLIEMQHEVTAAASVVTAANRIREDSLRRQLTTIGQSAVEGAANLERDVSASVASTVTALEDLNRSGTSKLKVESLGKLLDADFTNNWLIPGLLEPKERLMLTGIEGGGKSTLVRQIAILSAAGIHPFRLTPIEPLKVVVVDAENSRAQWNRQVRDLTTRAIEQGQADPRENLHLVCTESLDLLKSTALMEIHSLIDQFAPDILCIGPLYKLAPRAMNSDDDAIPLLSALDGLRKRGPALITEAHAGKAESLSGVRKMAPRGSAAFMGWPEFGLGLRPSTDPDAYPGQFDLVRWRGEREQREWPHKMIRSEVWPWMPVERQLRSVA